MCLLMSNGTTVGRVIFYTLLKSIEIDILVDLSFMLVLLTKSYVSFNASLIERHKHFP